MKIGLLIIASEVLEGKISDANTRSLALLLRQHHLDLGKCLTVRDSEKDIHQGLAAMLSEFDIILTSGGLGPTRDDLTKAAIASYFGKKIAYSAEAEKIAQENYKRFARTFPGKDHGYSWLPEGVIALSNPAGLAPGLLIEHQSKLIICAPGVPREFDAIMSCELVPQLKSRLKNQSLLEHIVIRTKRVPEEKIFGELDPMLWDKLSAFGEVSCLPVMMGVDIGVKIRAKNHEELSTKKNSVFGVIKQSPISPHIWNFGFKTLEEVIVNKANKLGVSYGFAESATGGLCSHKITSVSGSSQSFYGSVVSYDNSVKCGALAVPANTIKDYGVVSVQTAEAMAVGLRKALDIQIAISITGVAGPSGGTIESPVGTVCIGVVHKDSIRSVRYQFFGDRLMLKERFAQAALFELLEELEKIPQN